MDESTRGGARLQAGRPPRHPWLRAMWQRTGLRGPTLLAAALNYCAEHEAGFLRWLHAERDRSRPASVAPRIVTREPR